MPCLHTKEFKNQVLVTTYKVITIPNKKDNKHIHNKYEGSK